MNYELAKKLKEAGYLTKNPLHTENMDRLPYPTLEELISACGDKFEGLLHFNGKYQTNRPSLEHGHRREDWYWYTTPEEAVATLWLELNKK